VTQPKIENFSINVIELSLSPKILKKPIEKNTSQEDKLLEIDPYMLEKNRSWSFQRMESYTNINNETNTGKMLKDTKKTKKLPINL